MLFRDSTMFDYVVPVLSVLNQKGGVGKTTLSSIIGEYASIHLGKRVLVVDLDMQCNSSDYWVGMEVSPSAVGGQLPPRHPDYDGDPTLEERSSIADTFFGKAMLPYPTHINPANGFKGRVDVLMGHPERLELINSEYDNKSGRIDSEVISRVGQVIHDPELAADYDLVLLDTGPSRNPVFRAALRAATHVIVPFEPEEKSLQGINAMLQAINSENYSRATDNAVELVGLLPNKVRIGTNLHLSTLEMLQLELPDLMCPSDIYLPQATAFPERDIKGINPRSIFEIGKSHKARIAAEKVAEYILGKVLVSTEPTKTVEEIHQEDNEELLEIA